MNYFCLTNVLFAAALAVSGAHANAMTLETVLQKTIDNNPRIIAAKADLEAATGRRLVFRSIAYPNFGFGATGGVQGGYRAGQPSSQGFIFPYAGLIQPLFNAAIPASFRRGDVEVLIAQQRLNVAVMEQLHTARVAFVTALYNRSLTQLRAEQRERLEQNVSSQKDRYQSGLTDRGVVVGAEVQTRELDPRIQTAQHTYDTAILQLAEAMGENLGPNARLPEPEGQLTYAPVQIELDAETTAVLQSRPDLELARLMVRAAAEEQRIIEAEYYPSVTGVVAGYYIPNSGIRRQAQGSPRRTDDIVESELLAGGAYTWRVIDNGRVYGAVKRQRAIREINELTLRKLEADVPRQLTRIRNDFEAIATKQKTLARAAIAAEENSTTVQQNQTGGLASQYEFRLAQSEQLDIKSELLDLAYQASVDRAEWDRVTGRYFQFSVDTSRNVR